MVVICVCLAVVSAATRPTFTNFFASVPVAVDRSSSGAIVIRNVLPVFLDDVIFSCTGDPCIGDD